jgi:hypothetical protein
MFGWQVAGEAEWFNGQAWADLPRVPRQRQAGQRRFRQAVLYKIELGRTGKTKYPNDLSFQTPAPVISPLLISCFHQSNS